MIKIMTPLLAGATVLASWATAQTSPQSVFETNQNARTVVLEARLSPLNENPPVAGRVATGMATVTIRLDRSSASSAEATSAFVQVNINATTSENEVVTGAHIHRGAAGVNGPVVIDFMFRQAGSTTANQAAALSNSFEVTNADSLRELEMIVMNPANYYVNVHTQSNPGGHIRGQLEETGSAALGRFEGRINSVVNRLNDTVDKDLIEIRRLLVLLAFDQGLITPQEREEYLKQLADRLK